jgi:hypothetical protein
LKVDLPMPGLENGLMWLAIIAIATSVQSIVFVVAGIVGWRAYRQTATAIDRFQRDQLEPLVVRAHGVLDNVDQAVARVRSADDDVRQVIARTTEKANRAAGTVRNVLRPAIGLGQGTWAAVSEFVRPTTPRKQRAPDEEGEERFVYEGGNTNVRI